VSKAESAHWWCEALLGAVLQELFHWCLLFNSAIFSKIRSIWGLAVFCNSSGRNGGDLVSRLFLNLGLSRKTALKTAGAVFAVYLLVA